MIAWSFAVIIKASSLRDGEILKVLGEEGAPPYLVRWEDGHEAEVFPGSDMYVQHLKGAQPD